MDYSFISGQVRAQESKLLNVNRLDRMIGAKTPEEAFRVLSELQYSEYLEEGTTAQNFGKIIQQGLLETKQMLINGTDDAPGLNFIWLRFDINNLKRALKLKYLKGQKSIEEFTEDNGFSAIGRLTKDDLEKAVFQGQCVEVLDEGIFTVVSRTDEILEKNNQEFRFVEYALDQIYFETLSNIAEGGSAFLQELFLRMANSTNFRNLARSVFILGDKVPEEAWVRFGDIAYSESEKIENFGDFVKWAEATSFGEVISTLEEGNSRNLITIEKYLDKKYQKFLEGAALGEIASIQIPFVYFEKRLQNSRLLKFIMFAKFHGLSSDEIYKTLEKF